MSLMSNSKKFVIFAVLLFIGMWIGGMIGGYILPVFGLTDPTISTILSFILTILPAWFLIRKFGKKTV